jgi:predicted Fe-Mo cluster-binding NifX family protein
VAPGYNRQLVAAARVKAVLTGNFGPNAFQTLQAAKVEIFTGHQHIK